MLLHPEFSFAQTFQEEFTKDSVTVYFPAGKSHFDPAFQGDGSAIDAFLRAVPTLQRTEGENVTIDGIYIYSGSSPEGSKALETTPESATSNRDFFLKLNTLTLPLLVANLGFEFQPFKHFSLSMIAYYTSLNWFTETIKFRVLGVQPEIRWWPSGNMCGWYVGAHATFSWYNIALGGDWRYQDHATTEPVLGGGLAVGYKVSLDSGPDSRWGLEFSLGAGVLPFYYDIFYNVPNGRKAGEDRLTYWGIDQVGVTLTYRIGRYKVRERK